MTLARCSLAISERTLPTSLRPCHEPNTACRLPYTCTYTVYTDSSDRCLMIVFLFARALCFEFLYGGVLMTTKEAVAVCSSEMR